MLLLAAGRPRPELLRTADVTAAMTRGGAAGHRPRCSRPTSHALRPQPGQADRCRQRMVALLAGFADRRLACRSRQRLPGCRTPTRCAAPRQVARRCPRHPRAHARLGSPTGSCAQRDRQPGGDCLDGRVESNGNFHGAPVAYVLDFLAISGGRRRQRSVSGAPTGCWTCHRSRGLPPFLATEVGVDSGHMIAQYTQAAIVRPSSSASRSRPPSTPSRRRLCRRTTSRWAGHAGAQAAPSGRRAAPGCWPSNC